MNFSPFSIGKYRFVELLGKGGMAEVYRVEVLGPSGFQKEFAVKRILSSEWSNPEMIRMFEQEANLTSMLSHANIVQVFELIKVNKGYLLVMEFVHGRTLAELAKRILRTRKAAPLDLAVYVMGEVCKGLDYAHRKRDPAPARS